ncbi:probable xyloglucan galactosyltransferase GT12 [Carica papaya]|uniref:probable xyloglucan galactosyltransferase GT12 n=1 Tax=Carica papaya TaxID=3649 RepID=UPI000B8D0CDF|nr:probable xyloglucan galactosyltransferase GT12 [Carica papaya]
MIKMEKSSLGIWFLIVASLVSCLALLCADYLTFGGIYGITLLFSNFTTSIDASKFVSVNSSQVSSSSRMAVSPVPMIDSGKTIEKEGQLNIIDSVSFLRSKSPSITESTEIAINDGAEILTGGQEEDNCLGRYIYIHDLPSRFNDDVIKDCRKLIKWFDVCPFMANSGLGPAVENSRGVLSEKGWFMTNQFFLESIFRDRMKGYECLTNNSAMASAIYVPYFAGFDIGRHLWGYNVSIRDSLGKTLAKWLRERPEWKSMGGRDHFFVAGRIAWDFRRVNDEQDEWGSKLMFLPEFSNMTMLTIESTPWNNEIAIPYPTYFHPSSDDQVRQWQNRVRTRTRTRRFLFSFVGAPRPNMTGSIRGKIIKQCLSSTRRCKLLNCHENNCDDPVKIMEVFQDSVFCLQPPGDSLTRRSIFDSILAGCIPVFFHPDSAYTQYLWYFPRNNTKYSIFIPEEDINKKGVSIKKVLAQVRKKKVKRMREEVVNMIPSIIYADPSSPLLNLEDAFDVAVSRVLERVGRVRRNMKEGKDVAAVRGSTIKLSENIRVN